MAEQAYGLDLLRIHELSREIPPLTDEQYIQMRQELAELATQQEVQQGEQ